jgi:hypothetical protein
LTGLGDPAAFVPGQPSSIRGPRQVVRSRFLARNLARFLHHGYPSHTSLRRQRRAFAGASGLCTPPRVICHGLFLLHKGRLPSLQPQA